MPSTLLDSEYPDQTYTLRIQQDGDDASDSTDLFVVEDERIYTTSKTLSTSITATTASRTTADSNSEVTVTSDPALPDSDELQTRTSSDYRGPAATKAVAEDDTDEEASHTSTISAGLVIGIVSGVLVVIFITSVAIFLQRRRTTERAISVDQAIQKSELSAGAHCNRHELDHGRPLHEVAPQQRPCAELQ